MSVEIKVKHTCSGAELLVHITLKDICSDDMRAISVVRMLHFFSMEKHKIASTATKVLNRHIHLVKIQTYSINQIE